MNNLWQIYYVLPSDLDEKGNVRHGVHNRSAEVPGEMYKNAASNFREMCGHISPIITGMLDIKRFKPQPKKRKK